MAVYALYKYDFTAASEGALFAKDEEKSMLDKAQEVFEGFLSGKTTFPDATPVNVNKKRKHPALQCCSVADKNGTA